MRHCGTLNVFLKFPVLLGVFICKALNCEEIVVLTYEVFLGGWRVCVCVKLATSAPVSSQEESGSGRGSFTNAASRVAVEDLCRQAEGLARIDGMVQVWLQV